MIRKLTLILLVSAAACNQEPQKTAPAPATPPPAAPTAAPAPAADAGPPKPKLPPAQNDGLSLADRIKKRQAEENKLAAELAEAEKERTGAYDKQRLPLEQSILDFVVKTRAEYDKLAEKLKASKSDGMEQLEALRAKNEKAIAAQQKKRETIDPKGGNSLASTDLDVLLYALGHEYVDDLEGSLKGDEEGIKKQRAELDKRIEKLKTYFSELKSSGKVAKKK